MWLQNRGGHCRADLCVDIHASNIFLREIPQARVNVTRLRDPAAFRNTAESGFCLGPCGGNGCWNLRWPSLNSIGVPTVWWRWVLACALRVSPSAYRRNFLCDEGCGIWDGDVIEPKEPIVSDDGRLDFKRRAPGNLCTLCGALEKCGRGASLGGS